ncbi:hypothetical protein CAEBREN_15643 [Caenorhabditis brenneri]|uniref:Uncharacterized protein n=1 Tax=Caenorhabditis brenneri TaxID=135651 RepID=G0N2W5_CAEBE|nr:hypothetical protein CAEBREN_15643 [Caenorhabditis brenneri]
MTSKPAVDKGSFTTEDVVSIMGRLVGFFDEHIELINDNMPAKKFFIELLNKTFGVLMTAQLGGGLQDKDVEAFRVEFLKELATSFANDPKSLTKRQLFGFVVDLLYRDIKNMDASEEKKRKEETIANYEKMLNTTDPWVNYENKKYRCSRFMMLKRNACLFVKMPVTGEYLAMDKEKLENGFSRMGVPMKAEDLVGDDDDERIEDFKLEVVDEEGSAATAT